MKSILLTAALLAFASGVRCESIPEEKFDPTEVRYYFYSRNNIDNPIQVWIGNLNGALFGYAKSTKFIIHGYEQHGSMPWVLDLKLKLINAEDCNVIVVDWKNPAAGDYSNVRTRSKLTGAEVATFIKFLVERGTEFHLMHLIGYSIGAHVSGYAGKVLNGTLGRISGLDPNSRGFDYNDPSERLAKSDASFVDVIHTCGGDLSFIEPLGHVDFFPNNGRSSQPGCGLELDGSCSHKRAFELYAESTWSIGFRSLECTSWRDYKDGKCNNNHMELMGFKTPSNCHQGRIPFAAISISMLRETNNMEIDKAANGTFPCRQLCIRT